MIDAHHHFWHPARGDYGWMPVDNLILSRFYGPADLAPELEAAGVSETVLVQAAPTVGETEYLLGIADVTPHVAKVVGWVDFENPAEISTLARLAQHPKFVGVRPMIQDLPDEAWMLRDEVQWAYQAITDLNLTFDCLGFPQHIDHFRTLLAHYPDMRAVIDHCMKPQFRHHTQDAFDEWAYGMTRLAKDTNAMCKLSGLVTEADTDWSVEVLKPYTDHVLTVFGPDRVMWGSDWPVLRLREEYGAWVDRAHALTADLSDDDKARVFDGTARAFYRI